MNQLLDKCGCPLDVARFYQQRGLAVFPCHDDKRPKTAHGLNDASNNDGWAVTWFQDGRTTVLGLRTGVQADGRILVVVDVDVKNGIDGHDSLYLWLGGRVLPNTWTVITVSGGTHFYFWLPADHPVRNSASKLAPGVDIRGVGGYVIAAGSKTQFGASWELEASSADIAEAPDWLIDKLEATAPQAPAGSSDGAKVGQGSRNDDLARRVGRMAARGVPLDEVRAFATGWNAQHFDPPLDADELERTVLKSARDWRFRAVHEEARKYGANDETDLEEKKLEALETVPTYEALEITDDEMDKARLSPTCIVENYLYADVAILSAPGGTGKTTMCLHEDIQIAIGGFVWGMPVRKPGWVLIITAEDQREYLVARLKRLLDALDLSAADRALALSRIRIWDVTGEMRKLATVEGGNIVPTALADLIIMRFKGDPPVQVRFDPVVSFGASESMVNDNEQNLITIARYIRNAFDCCVRFIGHTGQESARNGTIDQYAGRGGTAMADGCRMVHVLQTTKGEATKKLKPPASLTVPDDAQIIILARPKGSYSPPNQPNIWLVRDGYTYSYALEQPEKSAALVLQEHTAQLCRFLAHEVASGKAHTKNTLETIGTPAMGVTRKQFREALAEAESTGRIAQERRAGVGSGAQYKLVLAK